MISINKYIEEELFPMLTSHVIHPIDNHGPHIDVGPASFNTPQDALLSSLKTKINFIKPDYITTSPDYIKNEEWANNGGTPPWMAVLKQFDITGFNKT